MSDKPTPRGAAGGSDSGDRIPDGRNFLDPSHPDQVHTPAKGREWTDRRIDTRKGMWGATSGPGDTSGYGGIVRTVEISGNSCLLYTSPSPRDQRGSRMPSSA